MSSITSEQFQSIAHGSQWTLTDVHGLTVIKSPLLEAANGLAHAFTTRLGGESPKPLESFNLGRHLPSEEVRSDAMRNRQRLCQSFSLDFQRLVVPGQVHSADVVFWDERSDYSALDGIAADKVGVPILLHYADCVPVIIFDKNRHAVAVVHAGWRGTAAQIVKCALAKLNERVGSKPSDIVAAVGPAIGTCCYPTGADVATKLLSTVSNRNGLVAETQNARGEKEVRPNLKAINATQLLESGVSAVDVSNFCTSCRPDLFYSHRQSGGHTGRQGALACLM